MKKFFNEFKEFAMRGNVLDMAIGVVLGSTARPSLWHTEHFSVHRRRPVTFGKGDGPPRRVSTS